MHIKNHFLTLFACTSNGSPKFVGDFSSRISESVPRRLFSPDSWPDTDRATSRERERRRLSPSLHFRPRSNAVVLFVYSNSNLKRSLCICILRITFTFFLPVCLAENGQVCANTLTIDSQFVSSALQNLPVNLPNRSRFALICSRLIQLRQQFALFKTDSFALSSGLPQANLARAHLLHFDPLKTTPSLRILCQQTIMMHSV
jgi:hypothetical protein